MDQLFVDFVSHAVQVGAIDAKEKFEEFWRVLTGGLAHVEKLPPFTALAAKNLAEGLPSQPGSGSGTNGNSSRPAWWPFCLKIYP
jgi:hypothetical protein